MGSPRRRVWTSGNRLIHYGRERDDEADAAFPVLVAQASSPQLTEPDLRGSAFTSLDLLRGMALIEFNLAGAGAVISLEPLRGKPLGGLDLSGLTGITAEAPLQGVEPRAIGRAAKALLATLEEA